MRIDSVGFWIFGIFEVYGLFRGFRVCVFVSDCAVDISGSWMVTEVED